MRLFIAIPLSRPVRDELLRARDAIAAASPGCAPVPEEDLHLTLAFLGETALERLGEVEDCMRRAAGEDLEIKINGLGHFPGRNGDLYWAGAERSPELCGLALDLAARLRERGFSPEDREFLPHVTLARRVRLTSGFQEGGLPRPLAAGMAGKMVLFQSGQTEGALRYRPLFELNLK